MKIALSNDVLLATANEELKQLPWYREGMALVEAEMKGEFLVMRSVGMGFEDGHPDPKLLDVINDFAASFSDRYTLKK